MESETRFAEGSRLNVRNSRWNLNNSRRKRRIGGRDHHNLGAYASREGRGLISKPPLYFVLKYMVPLVLALVTLRYEGKIEGPFEKNPAPTWCFLVSICVYCLIVGGMGRTQTSERFSQIFRSLARTAAILAIISLVSIFLPYPTSIVPIIICTSVQFVALAWPTLYHACSLIHRGIKSISDKIRAKIGDLTQEASLPR